MGLWSPILQWITNNKGAMGMSHFDDDDDFDTNESGSINQIRKALRAAEKRAAALEEELSSFRADSRKNALRRSIEERGLNPKIAAFVPQDVDTDSLGEWLDDYADVFSPAGVQQQQSDEPVAPEGADTFNEVANGGTPPSGDLGNLAQLISGAKTKEDLDRLIFGQ